SCTFSHSFVTLCYSTTYLFPLKQGRNCPGGGRWPTHTVVHLLALVHTGSPFHF
ncbi:hypothetical protein GOODEAATRI_003041, partial [Goodea atripinnis]